MAGKDQPKTGGRAKGMPNRTTAAIKDAILNAFEKVGGEDYLAMVARSDPRTFCTLLGRILPAEFKAEVVGSENLAERVSAARARLARARKERESTAGAENSS